MTFSLEAKMESNFNISAVTKKNLEEQLSDGNCWGSKERPKFERAIGPRCDFSSFEEYEKAAVHDEASASVDKIESVEPRAFPGHAYQSHQRPHYVPDHSAEWAFDSLTASSSCDKETTEGFWTSPPTPFGNGHRNDSLSRLSCASSINNFESISRTHSNASSRSGDSNHSLHHQQQPSYRVMKSSSIESIGTTHNDEPTTVYQVQFQFNFKDCKLRSSAQHDYSIHIECGSFVIVQSGEKEGYDIGVVTEIYTHAQYVHRRRTIGNSRDTEENKVSTILRLATQAERSELPLRVHNERALLQNVLHLIHRVFKLPMEVKGAEFQFDRRKLVVFYHSDSRIDFRELVRDLNLIYKMRIWMKKTNFCRPFEPMQYAADALRTGAIAY